MLVSASTCYVTLLDACVSTEQNTGSQYSPLSHPQAMFVVAALFWAATLLPVLLFPLA